METPLAVIGGHKKAVSYVRFLGGDQLVSASTDNKLKLWDINQATSSQGQCEPLMTYSGDSSSPTGTQKGNQIRRSHGDDLSRQGCLLIAACCLSYGN